MTSSPLLGRRHHAHWQKPGSNAISPERRRQVTERIARECGWRDADAMRAAIARLKALGGFDPVPAWLRKMLVELHP